MNQRAAASVSTAGTPRGTCQLALAHALCLRAGHHQRAGRPAGCLAQCHPPEPHSCNGGHHPLPGGLQTFCCYAAGATRVCRQTTSDGHPLLIPAALKATAAAHLTPTAHCGPKSLLRPQAVQRSPSCCSKHESCPLVLGHISSSCQCSTFPKWVLQFGCRNCSQL